MIIEIGFFITALIETLVNLLFEDFLNENKAPLISLKIDFSSWISFSLDFKMNLNLYLFGHLEEFDNVKIFNIIHYSNIQKVLLIDYFANEII